MAKVIRRHWLSILLNVLIVAGITAAILFSRPARVAGPPSVSAAVPPAPEPALAPLDPQGHSRIEEIRAELCLEGSDLAALGCDPSGAEGLLRSLRSWYGANRPALDAARAQERAARTVLRESYQAMHVGPRDEGLVRAIPVREGDLRGASQTRRTLVASAVAVVGERLTAEQEQAWRTARANREAGVPAAYRYAPAVTADQAARLKKALSRGDTAAATRVLGALQQASVNHAWANGRLGAAGVEQAEARALPAPPALLAARSGPAQRVVPALAAPPTP